MTETTTAHEVPEGEPPPMQGASVPDRADPQGEGSSWVRLALVVAATVALGYYHGLSLVLIVLALVFMIFMHELGHYLTARWAGMKVTEFFIGFGPRLWSFRRGETEYGLKAIPAGAYVRIIGMSNLEQVDPADEARTYRQKPYWRRMSVAVAGSTMHFLMAFLLVWTIFSGFGVPDFTGDRWSVGRLTENSPAERAGIELGDRIVSVDGRRFDDFEGVRDYLRANPGDEVALVVERGGRELALEVELDATNANGERVGFLGVGPEYDRVRVNVLSGAVESVQTTGEIMWLSVKGLGSFFSPDGIRGYVDNLTSATEDDAPAEPGAVEAPDDDRILSIYGAVRVATERTDESIVAGLEFLAAINIFIGIFNLVPLLPFDGGHVVIATYERLRSRRGKRYFADVTKLMPLTYVVVFALVLIFVSSLYLDIADPVKLQ